MARLLVTGASGFIGSHTAREAARCGWEVLGTYRSHPIRIDGCRLAELDLVDRRAVLELVSGFHPDAVIHTAANANMDRCEEDPEDARRCNVTATVNIADASASCGAHLVFTSTDAVFDGTRGMYSEEDTPNPTNVYAETKLQAEQVVSGCAPAAIIRTSINYGYRLSAHQGSFFQDILNALREGKSIPVFYDQYRNPIEVVHFSRALLELAETRYSGLLHVAGSQRCSRKEFAEAVCRRFGLPTSLLVSKSQDDVAFRVSRPRDISMRVDKALTILSSPLPDIETGLQSLSD